MPNVDICVRELEAALCRADTAENIAANFDLPEDNKVRVLRGKSRNEIKDFIDKSKKFIKRRIGRYYYGGSMDNFENIKLIPTSNNNRDGADIFHVLPNGKRIDIEVKFGAKTDMAIGMEVFEKIFGTNIFSKCLSKANRKEWIRRYISEGCNDDRQNEILFAALNNSIDDFNEFIKTKNRALAPDERKCME